MFPTFGLIAQKWTWFFDFNQSYMWAGRPLSCAWPRFASAETPTEPPSHKPTPQNHPQQTNPKHNSGSGMICPHIVNWSMLAGAVLSWWVLTGAGLFGAQTCKEQLQNHKAARQYNYSTASRIPDLQTRRIEPPGASCGP